MIRRNIIVNYRYLLGIAILATLSTCVQAFTHATGKELFQHWFSLKRHSRHICFYEAKLICTFCTYLLLRGIYMCLLRLWLCRKHVNWPIHTYVDYSDTDSSDDYWLKMHMFFLICEELYLNLQFFVMICTWSTHDMWRTVSKLKNEDMLPVTFQFKIADLLSSLSIYVVFHIFLTS